MLALTFRIVSQKSVAAYQQQQSQSAPTVSEIPSKPVWETAPAKNFAIDLKRLKAENLASKQRTIWKGLLLTMSKWAMLWLLAYRS